MFTIFEQSTTAYAEEINDNFYHIAQGNLLPRSGVSLTTIDSTYDLGSSICNWNNLFCNTLNIYSAVYSDNRLWQLLKTTILTVTASTIDILPAGFSGDNYEEIKISGNLYLTGSTIYLYFGDSLTCGYQYLRSVDTATVYLTAMRYTSQSSIEIGNGDTLTVKYCSFNCVMNTKTGIQRNIYSDYVNFINSTTIGNILECAGTWSASNTLTSLFILRGSVAGTSGVYFQPGCRVELWGRK
jgi:hypothetical protein